MTESNIETTNQAPKSIRIFSDIYLFKNKATLQLYNSCIVFGPKIAESKQTILLLTQIILSEHTRHFCMRKSTSDQSFGIFGEFVTVC